MAIEWMPKYIQRVDGLRCDDDHQHIVDDVNQEIDKRIKDEPFRP